MFRGTHTLPLNLFAITEFLPNIDIFGLVSELGMPGMEEDDDKTVVQTPKDKKLLMQELFGDDFEDDTESDTELDITKIE